MAATGSNNKIMRNINEIFCSLQGEGAHTGIPAVFIRFAGCNLTCSFCDTRHQNGTPMTDRQIFRQVNKYPQVRLIILTGGEPSLWIDTQFISELRQATGKKIAIETNGTNPLPDGIDWITLSPKTGFEGGDRLPVVLSSCDELKVVYTGQPLEPYLKYTASYRFLQPCWTDDPNARKQNIADTVAAVIADPRWRLSLQTHRLINIP